MIRAVLFDVDDTLCDDTGQMRRAIGEVAGHAARRMPGLETGALFDAYMEVSDHYWTYEISLTTPEPLGRVRERLWRRAFTLLGHDPHPEVLGDVVDRYGKMRRDDLPDLFDGVHDCFAQLRADGIKLGIVTNGLSETHVPKIAALGLDRHVDTVLMPDLTGVAKPDPRQFHIACERLEVAPHETAHVGDSLSSDVGGAVSAGLVAIWFNPHGHDRRDGAARPHAEVRSLREVPGRLPKRASTP